ncbi:MAG: hypothetical protein AAGH15_00495 [Myxococcota bacterium]
MAGFLGRYQIRRGRPLAELPEGNRQDARKHTRHVLRPEAEAVEAFLADPGTFEAFRRRYEATVARRFAEDRAPFDALAALAREAPVYLGCSCPTKRQAHPERCHTALALHFMGERYPGLDVRDELA